MIKKGKFSHLYYSIGGARVKNHILKFFLLCFRRGIYITQSSFFFSLPYDLPSFLTLFLTISNNFSSSFLYSSQFLQFLHDNYLPIFSPFSSSFLSPRINFSFLSSPGDECNMYTLVFCTWKISYDVFIIKTIWT